jgi:hypothetical protein
VPEQPAPNYDRLARLDHMGLVWLLRKRQVVALDAVAVSMRCDNGSILKFYRRTEVPPEIVTPVVAEIAKEATP